VFVAIKLAWIAFVSRKGLHNVVAIILKFT